MFIPETKKLAFNVEILMKDNRFGQSTVLSKIDYQKIRKHQSNSKHRLILDVAWFTGERWGCIVQLKVDRKSVV